MPQGLISVCLLSAFLSLLTKRESLTNIPYHVINEDEGEGEYEEPHKAAGVSGVM
jgi:hypothetical protein